MDNNYADLPTTMDAIGSARPSITCTSHVNATRHLPMMQCYTGTPGEEEKCILVHVH